MWALDPMLRGPDASARVILVLNQNHNASDMSWDAQAVKSISNLNLGPQITFRNAFNSLSLFKTEMIGIVWGWRLRNEAAFPVQVWVANYQIGPNPGSFGGFGRMPRCATSSSFSFS